MPETAQEWAQFFQSASIILAAGVAIFGIDAWRREYVGKRRMELAEEVLALFYQARDVIRQIRNPFGLAGEGETRKADPNESPEKKRALDNAYVVFERYNKHTELFGRLHALRYRFMAQIGIEEAKPFNDLSGILSDIFLAARQLSRYWTRDERTLRTEAELEKHAKKVEEAESMFWSGGTPDPIEERLEAVVRDIEHTCQRILSSKGTLFGLLNLPVRPRIRRWFRRPPSTAE
jgi:hypothetical protein